MKRSDIKVGESYYYDRSNDWQEARYGSGDRAVVVDDKRYRINQSTWGFREARYSADPKGTAVLVDIHHAGRESPERTAVPTTHLRGPWEATNAEVQERKRERIEAEKAKAERAEDLRVRATAAIARAAALGVKATPVSQYGDRPAISLSVEEFERLLDRLPADDVARAARVAEEDR